jgi:hypothetical protein
MQNDEIGAREQADCAQKAEKIGDSHNAGELAGSAVQTSYWLRIEFCFGKLGLGLPLALARRNKVGPTGG